MEIGAFLIGTACFLSVVALVGHGLWVLGAWIVSGGSPSSKTRRAACPRCGLPHADAECPVCGWPIPLPPSDARRQRALDEVAKQVERLGKLGLLTPDATQVFSRALDEESKRLVEGRPQVPSQAVPHPVRPTIDPSSVPALPASIPPAVPPPPPVPQPAAAARDDREFASEVPLAVRAADFAARQQPPPSPPPVSVPPPAPAPKPGWGDWFLAFMEERNIRWGELVGGLLIVCGSIALVISFWSAIAERPWLKFILFNGVTAGLFGIGFYSHYRWRLRTTSQGMLMIATLLVPLNFLAIAALSSVPTGDGIWTIVGEIFSAVLFAALVHSAAQVLVPGMSVWLVVGVLVPALAQLLVRRYVHPDAGQATLAALAMLPLACYLLVNAGSLGRQARVLVLSEDDVNAIFKFLGITTFAVVLPLALLLFKTGEPMATARQLPIIVALLGFVPLATGLLLWQKLAGRSLVALRTAGTSVAVCGAALSLASLVLSWPLASAMLPAALVEFAIFTFVAWWFAMPAAHVPAAACLAMGYLLAVNLLDGRLEWHSQNPSQTMGVLVSGQSGTLLSPLALLYAAAALFARKNRDVLLVLLSIAGGLAAISVGLVTWFGFGLEGDPHGAAGVYLLYALACLVVGARSNASHVAGARTPNAGYFGTGLAWLGSALLLAAVVQEVVFRYGFRLELSHAPITALAIFATLTAALGLGGRFSRVACEGSPVGGVLWMSSLAGSLAAASWLILAVPGQSAAFEAAHWAWLALVWLAIALSQRWVQVATLFQAGLGLAAVFGAVALLEEQTWFATSARPWLDPRTLQAAGLAVAGLNLVWAIARVLSTARFAARWPASWLATPWLAVDKITNVGLVALLIALASYAAIPGVRQELSPRVRNITSANLVLPNATAAADQPVEIARPPRVVPPINDFEWLGIPHEPAADWPSWLLLAGIAAVLIVLLRAKPAAIWLWCLFVALSAACPLAATRWEGQVAAASALRWFSAGLLLVGSAPIWCRTWIATQAGRLGWQPPGGERVTASARALVFFLSLFPPVAMALMIGTEALGRSSHSGSLRDDTFALTILSIVALLAALALREGASRWLKGTGQTRPGWTLIGSALVMVLGVAPLVAMVLYHVGLALREHPILGPDPQSIFFRMGLAGSYAAPILMTALVLVGHALRERSSSYALAGGLVLNAGATAAYLLAISRGGLRFDAPQWIRLAQLNAAVAACYAIAWAVVASRDRRRRDAQEAGSDFLFATQAALAPALTALVLAWAWLRLVSEPQGGAAIGQPVMNAELADAWGWGSFVLVCASVLVARWPISRRIGGLATSGLLVGLAIFAAVIASRWDTANWVAFNTLLVGHMTAAVSLLAIAWWNMRPAATLPTDLPTDLPGDQTIASAPVRYSALWLVIQTAIIFLLSGRELGSINHWWSVGGFGFLAVLLFPAMAWLFQRRRYLYLAAALFNLAGTIAWQELGILAEGANFLYVNVALLALPVVPWLLIELKRIRPRTFKPRWNAPPMHRVAVRLALGVLALCVLIGLSIDAQQWNHLQASPLLQWIALAVTAIAALACLWDSQAKDAIACLYVLGLIACGMLIDQFDLAPVWLLWMGNMVLAAYTVLVSYLWSIRRGLERTLARFGVAGERPELAGLGWLMPCNLMLVAIVVTLTGAIELTNRETSLRVLAAQATLAQVLSMALVARGDRRGDLQSIALALGAIAAVMFGWAWLDVDSTFTLLHGLVVVAAAVAAVAVLYGFGLTKLLSDASDWLGPARRLVPWLAATSGCAIAGVLGVEILEFSQTGEVRIADAAIAVVAATLAGLALAALLAAVLPGRDPLGLSERGRMLYVYGAEIVLALLFVHIRETMPWLFRGFFQQYWPLIVMAIAFGGIGFAEIFRRRQQRVLSEPLENTGALLPVLPVLGFWAADTRVDYSLLLLLVGVLYAGLSIARRSFGFGVLATLAANGGLWYFLQRQEGLAFLSHPQIWLIPPAACVLVAAYLNRRQLNESQMTAIRYFASMTIYLSSTGDIFLNGVADHLWLPLILAGLALLGIAAGIALRVRAFLFSGTAFLGLALFTMIWYAAVDRDQTWIWFACLVAAGLAIVALVGVFEMKRDQMLAMVEKLKQWDA